MDGVVECGHAAVAAGCWDAVVDAGAVRHAIKREVGSRDAVRHAANDSSQVWVGLKRLCTAEEQQQQQQVTGLHTKVWRAATSQKCQKQS
jgi:hypothetical protein